MEHALSCLSLLAMAIEAEIAAGEDAFLPADVAVPPPSDVVVVVVAGWAATVCICDGRRWLSGSGGFDAGPTLAHQFHSRGISFIRWHGTLILTHSLTLSFFAFALWKENKLMNGMKQGRKEASVPMICTR
jgi:hypothetical protein